MKSIVPVLSMLVVGVALLFAQTASPPSPRTGSNGAPPNNGVNPVPQSALVRILTPVAGQASSSNVVQLRFELTNPAASSEESPNFQLQIDDAEPVHTTSTEYTFTGLSPGPHSVTVELVDANNTPISGSRSSVQFSVKNPAGTPRSRVEMREYHPFVTAYVPRELKNAVEQRSAFQMNSLPLLSLIGFGVLIGGIASAFKTRR